MAKYTILTGEILTGHLYQNVGVQSVIYNSVTYTTGQTFRGVLGVGTFTYSGTGSQIVNELTEFQGGEVEFTQSSLDMPDNGFNDGVTIIKGVEVEFVQSIVDAIPEDMMVFKGADIAFVDNYGNTTSVRTRRGSSFYSVAAPTHTGLHNDTIAFFGDSLTANGGGYVSMLAARYPTYTMRSYAAVGQNIYTGLGNSYTQETNRGYSGQYVSICLGTNDTTAANNTGAQWKADFKSYIQAFITAGFPTNRLILTVPPSTSSFQATFNNAQNYIRQIAYELGIIKYDLAQRFIDHGGDILYLGSDGTHFLSPGHDLWMRGLDTFLDH